MKLLLDFLVPEKLESLIAASVVITGIFNIAVVSVISFLSWVVARKIVRSAVKYAVSRTKNTWDDILYEKKVFSKLANIAPALVVYLFSHSFEGTAVLRKLVLAYTVIVVLSVFRSLCSAFLEIYESFEMSKDKPLKGVVQIIEIFAYIAGIIVIISILFDKSPALLLSGLGAMTAVMMLVFRDTILGFVAGIQIISNNSIRKGDWIVMKQYDADGDVIDIALHSIKVQNWDKTIVSIPTHKFLEESFTNWRGMVESGGRRICRSINIDMSSVHYLSEEEINELKKIHYISDYLEKISADVRRWNEENKADTSVPVMEEGLQISELSGNMQSSIFSTMMH